MRIWINGKASTLEEASAQSVRNWLDDRLAVASRDLVKHVPSVMDSARFQTCGRDSFGTSLLLVLHLVAALDMNSASSVV